jgi:hypothetical protein
VADVGFDVVGFGVAGDGSALCCAQQTGMHILVVEALLIAIYSTWGMIQYL